MADYILERRVWLPRPRPEVFEFFADPRNLERLHPAWARPRWLAPPPTRLAAGAVLDFQAAWLPGRWRVMTLPATRMRRPLRACGRSTARSTPRIASSERRMAIGWGPMVKCVPA